MIKANSGATDHRFTYRVYMDDTDHMGIVYHANYLSIYERARTEMLRDHGFALTEMAIYDTHFAIHDLQIHYLGPARLDDVITVTTNVERKKSCSLIFRQEMHNQKKQLLCRAQVHVVCVNKNLKPKALPEEFTFAALGEQKHLVGGLNNG